ncbi:MAG: hypothetical protein CFH08_00809 [Alphaproteobacteria bacterium MarineAlpha3_Bin7]|nr:MAG: hypothetical protein CFH08_00809 [Alphaproteobacteria bacterium MarineAlpha3_Bin7]
MVENPSVVEQLRPTIEGKPSIDVAALFGGTGAASSTSFSNQIQFSSVLKAFVDTPQQALSSLSQSDGDNPNKTSSADVDRIVSKDNFERSKHSGDSGGYTSRDEGYKVDVSDDIGTSNLRPDLDLADRPEPAEIKSEGSTNRVDTNSQSITTKEHFTDTTGIKKLNQNTQNLNNIFAGTGADNIQLSNPISKTNQDALDLLMQPKLSSENSTLVKPELAQNTQLANSSNAFTKKDNPRLDPNTSFQDKGSTISNSRNQLSKVDLQSQELAQKIGQDSPIKVNISNAEIQGRNLRGVQTNLSHANQILASEFREGGKGNFSGNFSQNTSSGLLDRQFSNNRLSGNSVNPNTAVQASNLPDVNSQMARVVNQGVTAQQINNALSSAGKTNVAGVDNINAPGASNQASLSQLSSTNKIQSPQQPKLPSSPTATQQVSIQIQKALANGLNKVNIKLHPAQLGRVEVRLDIAPEGQLTASITAEKPETLDLLQKDIRGLVKALQESGLNTNSNSFNFALRKDQENQLNGGSSKSDLNAELDDEELEPIDLVSPQANSSQFFGNVSEFVGIDIRV